ncbi:hypothetical protein SUDANB178_05459 [Streptomyces sp. enrichment culture]
MGEGGAGGVTWAAALAGPTTGGGPGGRARRLTGGEALESVGSPAGDAPGPAGSVPVRRFASRGACYGVRRFADCEGRRGCRLTGRRGHPAVVGSAAVRGTAASVGASAVRGTAGPVGSLTLGGRPRGVGVPAVG